MHAARLQVVAEPPTTLNPEFVSTAKSIFGALNTIASDRTVELPDTRLVAANDLFAAITAETARLGLEPDHRPTLERIGGEVGGKCLTSSDGSQASVIVPLVLAASAEGHLQLLGGELVAHELCHLLYGALRQSECGPDQISWEPWVFSEIAALRAAEEFRVTRLGDLMAEGLFNPRDEDGNDVRIADLRGSAYREGLPDALTSMLPGCLSRIWDYRVSGEAIEDMWRHVLEVTLGTIKYLAHAEARSLNEAALVIEGLDHPAAGLVGAFWRQLMAHVLNEPLVPEPGTWVADDNVVKEIGRQDLTELWRRLGLESHPVGDSFYIGVSDSDLDLGVAVPQHISPTRQAD